MDDTRLPGPSGPHGYTFGPFVVDPIKWRLWRDGSLVPITGKTFDLLLVLIENRDRIIRKDELMARVWPDTAVDDNNLPRQMSFLRRALGQRPDQPEYVVTIPGHGYRFVASVQELTELPPALRSGRDAHSPSVPGVGLPEPSAGNGSMSAQRIPGVRGGEADPDPSATPRRRWTVPWALAVASCGLLAVAAALALLRAPDPTPQPRRTLQRVTYGEAALPRDAAWAPDGQWVVYASDMAGSGNLWKQRVGDPDPVRLATGEANVSQPQWSPAGDSIVFRSERDGGGLYVIPSGGGAARIVSNFGYEPRWSPDGTLILFKRTAVIPNLPTYYVVGLDGKPPRPVRPDVLGRFSALHAAWHPDSRRISIWGTTRSGDVSFLTVPLAAGSAVTTQMSAQVLRDLASVSAGRFVWAPSRRYIFFEGLAGDTQNIWRVTLDPKTENWVDGPERLTTGAGQETTIAVSPDGTRLIFHGDVK